MVRQEKKLTAAKRFTAVPARHRPALPIGETALSNLAVIEQQSSTVAADAIAGHRRDALQQWHVFRKVVAVGSELAKRLRQPGDNHVAKPSLRPLIYAVKPDRSAGTCVPEQARLLRLHDRHHQGCDADTDTRNDGTAVSALRGGILTHPHPHRRW